MLITHQQNMKRYGIALIAPILALLLSVLGRPLTEEVPLLFFVAAIVVSAGYGRFIPGMLTALLSLLFLLTFVLLPVRMILSNATGLAILSLFVLVAGVISWFAEGRRRAEAAVGQQREQLRTTLMSMGDGVVATDNQQRVIWMNGMAEKLSGWKQTQAVGHDITEVFHILNGYTRQPAENPNEPVIRQGIVLGGVYHTLVISRHAQEVVLDDSSSLLQPDDLEIGGTVWVFRDVTASKIDQRILSSKFILSRDMNGIVTRSDKAAESWHGYPKHQKTRQVAKRVTALKARFLTLISHELRTPLTSIKGFTTTLLAKDVIWDTQSQREFLEIINVESDRLTNLINQLIDLSHLQAGTMPIKPVPCTVNEIIEYAHINLISLTSHHQFSLTIPPDLPPVRADVVRITQVLTNIIGNAVKYAPSNTLIELAATLRGEMVQFDVSDQGPGIPPEAWLRVFEAFERLDLKEVHGAGLGLAICKGILEAHHGQIWIASRPYPGTTISFTLPIIGAGNNVDKIRKDSAEDFIQPRTFLPL